MGKKLEIVTPIEFSEVIPAQELAGINYARRLTFGRLIAQTALHEAIPDGYATDEDLFRARPDQLNGGLYILPQDARYEDAELRIKDTVFPSQEFHVITRSPTDLARSSKANTRRSRAANPDRDETIHASMRSAGHALEGKLQATDDLLRQWREHRWLLSSLAVDLGGTYPHWKGKNLEARRESVDKVIHQTAEVAVVNQPGLASEAVDGIHRAIKVHLYRTDTSNEHRIARWLGYMKLVDRHTRAKIQIADRAQFFAGREFLKYKPYLEDALF